MLLWAFVLATSIWVGVDASNLGAKKGSIGKAADLDRSVYGLFDMGPVGWFFACLLLWIVSFPAYLACRPKYVRLKEGRV